MEQIKKAKWGLIITGAVAIAVGVCAIVWPGISALTVCYIMGGALIISGAVRIVSYCRGSSYGYSLHNNLSTGLMLVTLGVLLAVFAGDAVLWMPVAVGIIVIMEAMISLEMSFDAKRAGIPRWWIALILSVVSAAAGVLLIVNPFEGALAVMTVLGITLIISGVDSVCTVVYFSRFIKDVVDVVSYYTMN